MSPIIDLDAALGPFNTPLNFGSDWDSSQRGGTRKRAMHSAAGLGGFTGPGMHYHRRAESAPEFENPRFGLHRLGSSSTMADVFEEDEDEEWEDAKASSDRESSNKAAEPDESTETGLGIDIKVVDSEGMDAGKIMDFDEASFRRGVKRKGSGLSEGDRRNMSSTKSVHSATSLMDEPIQEESLQLLPFAPDLRKIWRLLRFSPFLYKHHIPLQQVPDLRLSHHSHHLDLQFRTMLNVSLLPLHLLLMRTNSNLFLWENLDQSYECQSMMFRL